QLAEEEAGYAGEEWAEGEWVQNEAGEMVWQPAEGGEPIPASEWSQGDPPEDEPKPDETVGEAVPPASEESRLES
ncbi:MAG: hypothetical protein LC708_04525, partial [Actinobacteria bacterium]|nr:hypothetical protein [Actinomycetota bacterium]